MKTVINENFILKNDVSKKLYKIAKEQSIIDYHCHLSPEEIANNMTFDNITQLWLYGDHYKWRLMRTMGFDEKYITGDATDFEKFEKWAETVENSFGNPLYHWTHLELKRYFDFDEALSKANAKEVYEHCNKIIKQENFDVVNILKKFKVETICTTDDPIDNLEYHKKIASDDRFSTKVLPTFRPSNAMNIEANGFVDYIKKLSDVSGMNIENYDDLIKTLYQRVDYFNSIGCKLSDHSLEPAVFEDYTSKELNNIVKKALNGNVLDNVSINKYKTAILHDLSVKYCDMGWTSQLHIGALRNNNTRLFNKIGADTGFDAMDDKKIAFELANTLNKLDEKNKLGKTIIYTLNPVHNDTIVTVMSCFQGGGIKGKIQFGSGWWFNDSIDGMKAQISSLANNGLLYCFVGMLTDSRSFLSYPRHEYFRRIVCDFFGEKVENGEYPNDENKLNEYIENICYKNAKEYFKF